jgi:hypothetical protein
MKDIDTQTLFFQHIKTLLPDQVSMVDEIADLLNISTDSAYRRIRGEKPITLEEIKILTARFNISIDSLLHRDTTNFVFSDEVVKIENYSFKDHLEFHLNGFQLLKLLQNVSVIFFTRDIAIFYFYQFPELLAFKYFYWMKTVFGSPEFAKKKFLINDYIETFAEKARKAAMLYIELDCKEIWAVENINLTLQQIQFYKDTDTFADVAEIDTIYNKVENLIDHIEAQAEVGKKFYYNEPVQQNAGRYELYVNEFMIGGNNILVTADDRKIAFINHSIMNYLRTDNKIFCDYVQMRINNVLKKSDPISIVGERQRTNFFKKLRARISYSRTLK